jgi:hypothetical protein
LSGEELGDIITKLFEICGLASFNLSPEELDEWFYRSRIELTSQC